MSDPEQSPETTPTKDTPPSLDLSELKMVPDWVANFGSNQSLSKFEGKTGDERRGGRRGGGMGGPPRGDRRGPGGPGGERRGGGGGPRRDGDRPRREGERDFRGPRGKGQGFGRGRRDDDRSRGPRYEIPKDVTVTIEPSDAALDALAGHVRSSTHAFSMFDASRLVLSGNDRFRAKFTCDEKRPTGLFGVTEGGGLYLSREEALAHALTDEVLDKYYRAEEYEKEEPKGIFTSIGVCGFSGTLIGPPSHHSYQNNVRTLHRERFSNMSVEDYKRRIKIESDPEVIERWKEEEKKGQRWTYRPSEEGEDPKPLVFERRADVEAHFRRTHGDEMIREMREVAVAGDVPKDRLAPGLGVLVRQAVERAQKHLFEMSQKLAAGLERRGLKTFKRRSGKFFVSRTRPRAIPDGLIFADRLAQIVEMVKGGNGVPLKEILESLAPTPKASAVVDSKLSEEQMAVLKDLHWLSNEGYIIEYSDGMVFLGVQGDPAKPKEKKAKSAPAPAGEALPADDAAPATNDPAAAEPPPPQAAEASPSTSPAEPELPVSSTEEAPPPDDDPPAPEPGPATVEEPPPAPEPEVNPPEESEAEVITETKPEPEAPAEPTPPVA